MDLPRQAPDQITIYECAGCGRWWTAEHTGCPRCPGRPAGDPVPYTRYGSRPRAWWYPAWQMTRPLAFSVFRGGDEWNRRTVAVQLGPAGCVVIADPRRPAVG